MPTINSTTQNQNPQSQWVRELAKTMSPQHLHVLLLNTIRDIARGFTIAEKEKMHRIRSITEAYDAWQNQTRQSA